MHKHRELSVVGKGIPAKDAREKVTGTLTYAVDFAVQGMVYGKILRSLHPHAKILKIDTSKAEALPGVLGVVTHEDAPDLDWNGCWYNYRGHIFDGIVRFVGDEVAAVAATSCDIAQTALALIDVAYEELPAVFDPEAAMSENAPKVRSEGNVRDPVLHEWGDLTQGEKESDLIVETSMNFGSQQYAPLGRNAAIAQWEGDKVTLWTSTQTPSELKDAVCEGYAMPGNKVRVIGLPSGCSFGQWWSNNFMMIAILLAQKVKKPVKIELDNEECMGTVKRRHLERTRGRMGCTNDGSLTFIDVDHRMDNGAYGVKIDVGGCAIDLWGKAPHGKYACQGVSTNLVTAGCMRGVGDVTTGACVERLADMLAEKVNMDPVKFRLKNQIRSGDPLRKRSSLKFMKCSEAEYKNYIREDMKETWPELFHLSSGETKGILEKGAVAIGWKDKWKGWRTPYHADGPKRRAIGVGTAIHYCGTEMEGNTAAIVTILKDGSAKLNITIGRMGSGGETTQSQIASETLGIAIDKIEIETGDTDACPWSHGSIASNTTYRSGFATWSACLDAKNQLLELAARDFFDTDPSKLDVKDGVVFLNDVPENTVSIPEIMTSYRADALSPLDSITGRSSHPMPPSMAFARHFAAHFVDLEVDVDTGEIRLLDYVATQDSGTVVNPKILENQIIGGAIAGAGFSICEELVFDETSGKVMNANLLDYKVLRSVDFPAQPRMIFAESYDPVGPFGARSAGETPIAAPVPAIAQAVYNAVGVRIDIPMTPERVLKALRKI
ncbi:MAG: molybdopterin-dependent oxidoreductase [Deltaproteobacteria bacterium]|nr:molybdopterin-dependent oxidoreductase [Deltaproteobacteria bacterium]